MKHVLLFAFLSGSIAQNFDWDEERQKSHINPEKIENIIIWRLTSDLDLSTSQAEKFFPRFRDHRKNLEILGKQEREMIRNIEREKLNKSDVRKTIENISKLRQKRIELESEFVLSLDDVLSPKQMIMLGIFKQRMMMEMRKNMRDGKERRKHHKKNGRKQGLRRFKNY